MATTEDLKSTLNLPRTEFPMKANLPQAEPKRLEEWRARGVYARLREARKGKPKFVFHDGPPYANGHIHLGTVLNKVLKDVVVRSRTMSGPEGHDAPYVPGWDCHGLPIELRVDKDLGAKKRDMSPVAFRRECREYAEKYVAIQKEEFERLGVWGDWEDPYLTMNPGYQATIVRQLALFVEKGLVYKAKKSVHWCISCRTALAEAEVEYDEAHVSPSIDVRFALSRDDRERLAERHPALAGKNVFAVIWTTTPWTLPANLALAFHPDAEYAFYPVEGTGDVLLFAKALREGAPARWNKFEGTLGAPVAESKGKALEGLRFRHPWVDRDSPAVLADYVTLDTGTGVVHTAPGHGWDDYVTGMKYGLDIYSPVDESGRFAEDVAGFAGQRVFDANPAVLALLEEKGALLGSGKETPRLPGLLALQEPDHLPRHRAVVHRPRPRRLPRPRPGGRLEGPLVPRLGRGAHPQHDRHPAGLVHLAPEALGRAHHRLLLRGLRRGAPHAGDRAARGGHLRDGDGRRLVRARGEGPPARGLPLPEVRWADPSRRRRTSSTCGSTPAPRTPPCWRSERSWAGRPTCTWRARTSTGGGSTRRCSSAWPRAARRPTGR